MTFRSFASIAALTLLSAVAYAGSVPPKELYGKSIIVTWREHRSQREFGQSNFRDVDVPLSRTIYISTKGQWFVRFTAGTQGAKRENVGTSETTAGGGPHEAHFSGRTITVFSIAQGGMARRMTIDFNEQFTTCEAQVTWAKQAGSDVVMGYNLNTGAAAREIRSAAVTGAGCSVRDGNVFAQ